MKRIGFILLLFTSGYISAQKYFTKTGFTEFKASVEAFEAVEAKNESTTAILNTENGAIATLLFVKAFHFKVALMQEHFNENYMDSDKFPKATFKGKIIGFDVEKLSEVDQEYTLKGTLNIRGKTKTTEMIAKLKKEEGKIILSSEFKVSPKYFDIDIPKIVRKKIAEVIDIKLHYELVEKK